MRKLILFFSLIFYFSNILYADVKVPNVFGNHMVLQQKQPIKIWGFADPGENIKVILAGKERTVSADNEGRWMVEFPPMEASFDPIEMIIQGKNRIVFKDILIGEVWLCSGQSNMEMGILKCFNAEKEVREANYRNIRLFDSPRATSPVPLKDIRGKWRVCTPENITYDGWGGFSAAAYFFGRKLYKELNVPIGLFEASWGGSKIEAWIPPEAFAKVKALRGIWKFVEKTVPGTTAWKEAVKKTISDMELWLKNAKAAFAQNKFLPPLPKFSFALPQGNRGISGLYHAMIHPIIPFGIRGVIWYQGEANNGDRMLYKEKMKALIYGWRELWKMKFPFYYVQIAPYRYGGRGAEELPYLWEAQYKALEIENTGMAQTQDIGNIHDIHPKNKQEVGRRLALIALAKTYGKKNIIYFGPVFKSLKREGNTIKIKFKNVGTGLASRDGKPLNWFEISGKDGKFVKAEAKIEGNDTVVVWSDKVEEPYKVRFGWSEVAVPNLMNKEGFPAYPFRAALGKKL